MTDDLFDDVDPRAETEMITAKQNDKGCLIGLAVMVGLYAAGTAIVWLVLQLFR